MCMCLCISMCNIVYLYMYDKWMYLYVCTQLQNIIGRHGHLDTNITNITNPDADTDITYQWYHDACDTWIVNRVCTCNCYIHIRIYLYPCIYSDFYFSLLLSVTIGVYHSVRDVCHIPVSIQSVTDTDCPSLFVSVVWLMSVINSVFNFKKRFYICNSILKWLYNLNYYMYVYMFIDTYTNYLHVCIQTHVSAC